MTDFTSARLAELKAVAEAATPGPWVFDPPGMWGDEDDIPQSAVRQIDSGSITWDDHGGEVFKPEDAAHIATFDPPTALALIAALEAKTAEVERITESRNEWASRMMELASETQRADRAEAALEAKTAEVEDHKQRYPCDGGCSYNDGPQEECSLHGRNPRDLWEVIGGLARERDEARATLKAKDSYACDLEEQLQHIKSLWRATGRAEADAHRRADRAEAALERVREAATEVANQGDNHGRTHYEGCWKHHLHCLAAKIIYEAGGRR